MRFLGRKVYVAFVEVLQAAIHHEPSARRLEQSGLALLGTDLWTLARPSAGPALAFEFKELCNRHGEGEVHSGDAGGRREARVTPGDLSPRRHIYLAPLPAASGCTAASMARRHSVIRFHSGSVARVGSKREGSMSR